ncbi:mitochondrial antiviral-signaling protein [Athene noctua]|uniref:mitochondrial antiviral-signaling protein n=1 Tax=Athene noctua TaxID=126797 RepID=UPI003EBC4E72
MGLAEEKVYEYIMKNLKNFKNIRVSSLADSLTCLTDADRDELHTREETRGSQATAYRFYQHLKCRQGWVPDLINALRQNNAGHLADELQHVYDTLQARAQAPSSFPPAASDAHPSLSSLSAQMPSPGPHPAPLAQQPHRDLPAGSCSPLLPGPAAASSMDLDARAPVQESLPKNLPQESPQRLPPGSAVCDGEEHLLHPTEAVQVAAGTPEVTSVAMPSSVPPEQGRDWLSRRQHPVCVDNGCFGNANHLHRGAPGLGLHRSLPPRDAGLARSSEQLRNEPQEDSYVSTESSLRLEEPARRGELQPSDSLPKNQDVPSSKLSEPPGSSVDVRSPLLIQQQFDAEQKLVRMLREDGENGDTLMETTTPHTTLVLREPSPSCDTSVKPPVQEQDLPVGETAGSTPSVLTKEKVLPASVDSLPAAAASFEGRSGRTASRVSSAKSIWMSGSNMERDMEVSKPGVLLSTDWESPEAASRHPSSQGPGGPHFGPSDSLTFSGDPLLVSTDTSSSGEMFSRVSSGCSAPPAHEDPGEEEAAGTSRDSRPPPSWVSTSLGTHEVHVEHYPSSQLKAGNDLQDGAGPLGNAPFFCSSEGHGAVSGSSQANVPPVDNNGPSLLYMIPAVGIAVISAVAFLVYARLQK